MTTKFYLQRILMRWFILLFLFTTPVCHEGQRFWQSEHRDDVVCLWDFVIIRM